MRKMLLAAGLTACLGLAACDKPKEQATDTLPAKKSQSRSVQMYAGQEPILQVASGSVEIGKSGGLILKAQGKTATPGYSNIGFLPRINAAAPPDGIYDVDVVGDRPAGAAAQAVTPVSVNGQWASYPKGRLKGVRFMAKTNSVTATLPQG